MLRTAVNLPPLERVHRARRAATSDGTGEEADLTFSSDPAVCWYRKHAPGAIVTTVQLPVEVRMEMTALAAESEDLPKLFFVSTNSFAFFSRNYVKIQLVVVHYRRDNCRNLAAG